MLIAISGTPGTGKTAVAKILAKKLNGRIITTSYLIRKYNIKTSFDRKRKTKIIDARELSAAAKKESNGIIIFEGHLSHLAPADATVVLRTSPAELEKRLRKRGWNRKKTMENVEAEAIGIISSESDAMEIDTTHKSPRETAELIQNILSVRTRKHSKKIDWTKEYSKFLARKCA